MSDDAGSADAQSGEAILRKAIGDFMARRLPLGSVAAPLRSYIESLKTTGASQLDVIFGIEKIYDDVERTTLHRRPSELTTDREAFDLLLAHCTGEFYQRKSFA
jgi:hypothetical protein